MQCSLLVYYYRLKIIVGINYGLEEYNLILLLLFVFNVIYYNIIYEHLPVYNNVVYSCTKKNVLASNKACEISFKMFYNFKIHL